MSSPLVRARARVGTSPLGLWVLTQAVCWSAPYFRSIRPRFLRLDPLTVTPRVPKRRAVTNHLGTVHAISLCNAAELVAGLSGWREESARVAEEAAPYGP